jgi:hypothetical protein
MVSNRQHSAFFTIAAGLIILTALWLPDLLEPAANYPPLLAQPLQAWLLSMEWMSGASGLWINLGLTVLTAGLLFVLNLKHLFINTNDRLMLLTYIALSSALPETLYCPEARIAAIAVIIGIHYLFESYQRKTALAQLFLSAFWTGIATLFYFPAIAVLFVVIIGIITTRPFSWRDWPAFLTGFLCPYFYCGLYFFWVEDTIAPLWHNLEQNFHPLTLPVIARNLYEYIFVITLIVIIVWVYFIRNTGGVLNKIKVVHLREAINWLLFFILISAIVFRPLYGSIMPLLAIPLAIIIANAGKQLWRKKVYLFLLLLLATAILGSRIM